MMFTTDLELSEMMLPTELASILINGDYSIIDYVNDHEYSHQVTDLLNWLDYEGLECVDMLDDNSFMKYHDAREFGMLAGDVSTFVFRRVNNSEEIN